MRVSEARSGPERAYTAYHSYTPTLPGKQEPGLILGLLGSPEGGILFRSGSCPGGRGLSSSPLSASLSPTVCVDARTTKWDGSIPEDSSGGSEPSDTEFRAQSREPVSKESLGWLMVGAGEDGVCSEPFDPVNNSCPPTLLASLVCCLCGVEWCGVVWCGVVWCGEVWCGVVWCGVVLYGVYLFLPKNRNGVPK